MIPYVRKEYRLKRIQAEVLEDNRGSIKLLEKLGFQREGLLRQYEKWGSKGFVDLLMYSLIFSDPAAFSIP